MYYLEQMFMIQFTIDCIFCIKPGCQFCFTGENLTSEFKQVNPFLQVPVIDDDGFKLTERYYYYAFNML